MDAGIAKHQEGRKSTGWVIPHKLVVRFSLVLEIGSYIVVSKVRYVASIFHSSGGTYTYIHVTLTEFMAT